jgi:hypothetical protein
VADVADEWLARRVNVAEATRHHNAASVAAIKDRFGQMAPGEVTSDAVQAWVDALLKRYAVGTVRLYRIALGQVLDFADVERNPAKSRRVTLPRQSHAPRSLAPTS